MTDFLKPLSRVRMIATCIVLLGAVFVANGQERVFITEFMAANTKTVMDRDREYSDWIELYNAGASNVNLNGWHLTDDRRNLKKWRFPSVSLPPSEYLLVFASGKDRRLAGSDLHTNFKLDAAGEYLALVKPDGVTVACDFAPAYPAQQADVSYGLGMGDRSAALVPTNAPKRVLVPTGEIGMRWATAEFDDRTWRVVTNGLGFDTSGNYGAFLGADLREAMLGKSSSAYVRIPFMLPESGYDRLRLRLRYDDGFAAYLNGWDVARRNTPAPIQWNSTATASHGVPVPVVLEERFEGVLERYALMQLDPATRAKVSAPNTGSAGPFLRLVNGRAASQVNSVVFPQIAPGVFESVSAEFDFRCRAQGQGGNRLALLLIPVAPYGTNGPGLDLATIRSLRDVEAPGVFALVLNRDAGASQSTLSVHWNRSRQRTLSLAGGTLDPKEFHRLSLALDHTPEGAYVTVALAAAVNTRFVSRSTPINRMFVRGLNPYSHRVQIAARITDWDQVVDIDNVRERLLPKSGVSVEEFDLSTNADVLRPGTNLLAIHGLNVSAADPTFLLQPEIVIAQGSLQPDDRRYFLQATPRGVNSEGYAAVAPPPVVSAPGGIFKDSVTVELKSPVTNGIVRYTVNGNEPTPSSDAYTQPIVINACVQLRAKTFAAGQLPSATVTETYSVLDDTLKDFTSNLPLVLINPFGKYISAYNKSPIAIRIIDAAKGRSALTGPADFDGRGTLNVRGFSTLRQPKNSYTLHLRDENGDKLRVGILGMPKDADWVLYAPYADKTLIRDALAYDLSNKMGQYASRTRFVEVFVHRYGSRLSRSDYHGVYVFEEKITRGKNRVNVEEMIPSDNEEPAVTGGYIIKRDHSQRREPGFYTNMRGVEFFYVYPETEDISPQQRTWIARYMNEVERSIYGPNFMDPKRGYAAYLDVGSFIDHHWLVEMSKNIDGLRYSAFMHKDRGGKLVVGPAWDWNLSWGNADYQNGWQTDDWYTDLLRESEICWYRRLSQDPEFMQRTIDRWWELRRTVFDPASISTRVDEWAALLNEAQERNYRRWPIMGRNVNPNYYVGQTYRDEINWMKQWIRRRIAWIDSQFLAPPALSPAPGSVPKGSTLTLRAPAGRIFYTLDGTDPRQPGGAVNPNAKVYKDPIPVTGSARLFARVLHNSSWSGTTVGEFKAAP